MRTRVGLNMSPELKEWYIMRGKETGVSFGTLMTVILQSYKDSVEAVKPKKPFANVEKLQETMKPKMGRPKNANTK